MICPFCKHTDVSLKETFYRNGYKSSELYVCCDCLKLFEIKFNKSTNEIEIL